VIAEAISVVFQPSILLVMVISAAYGLFVGAVPGLTATMAVALMVPFTFYMDPAPALAGIVTVEAMAIFAGDIPAALIRIPGTPSSAALTEDAYALACRGRAHTVLGAALSFSVAGGFFGAIALMLAAPVLAAFALNFTSYEYFWLALLGLSSAALVAKGSPVKGILSLGIGLLLSTVGLDPVDGFARFSFGNPDLAGGVSFIPAMIGLFGFSEVLRNILQSSLEIRPVQTRRGEMFQGLLGLMWRRKKSMLRSATIGTLIGALPGAGADIAAWISFGASKKFSRTPHEYGRGSLEGVTDASTAHNAALAGAWVPALVFGIPGDTVTAIVIGVLLMKGVQPGPAIFENQPQMLYSVYVVFLLANLMLLPLGYLAIHVGSRIVTLPRRILLPGILLFCVVGAFAINSSTFDIGVMIVMGIVGYYLEANGVPVGPIVLGLVLGPMIEHNLMNSLIKSQGNLAEFFTRPVAGTLGGMCLFMWMSPLLLYVKRRLAQT
jgi:TctA family transporter